MEEPPTALARLNSPPPLDVPEDGTDGVRTGDGGVSTAAGDGARVGCTGTGARVLRRRRVVRDTKLEHIPFVLTKTKIILPRPMPASYSLMRLILTRACENATRLAKIFENCDE